LGIHFLFVNALTCKDKIRLFPSKTLTNNCLSSRSIGICIPEKDFRHDRREDVQDRGYATGKARVKSSCYIHIGRSVGRSAPGPNCSDDFPTSPSLPIVFPFPFAILSPGRGVQQAWLLANLFPTYLSLALSRLLPRPPSHGSSSAAVP